MRPSSALWPVLLVLSCSCAQPAPVAGHAPAPSSSRASPSAPAPEPTVVSASSPEPEVEPEPPAHTRQEVLRRGVKKFRDCYDRALKSDPDAHGKVTLKLRLDAEGHVVEVAAKADPGVEQFLPCLTSVARGFVFPPLEPLDDREIQIPILFVPGRY